MATHISSEDLQYLASIEEVVWGGVLLAITLAIHGMGMIVTLQAVTALKRRFEQRQSFFKGMAIIILASWMMIMVHIIEAIMWGRFFVWKGAMPTVSLANYVALMDYTTLGSPFYLPMRWRLLEGMIAIAGLMTFAWSTGVLLTLAQDFQEQSLQRIKQRREKHSAKPALPPVKGAGQ